MGPRLDSHQAASSLISCHVRASCNARAASVIGGAARPDTYQVRARVPPLAGDNLAIGRARSAAGLYAGRVV